MPRYPPRTDVFGLHGFKGDKILRLYECAVSNGRATLGAATSS